MYGGKKGGEEKIIKGKRKKVCWKREREREKELREGERGEYK